MRTITLYPGSEINLDYNAKIVTLSVVSKDEFGVVHGFLEEDETVSDKSGSMIETGKVIRTPVSMSLF